MANVMVKGLQELNRQFTKFGNDMHRELKGEIKQAIKEVATDAKANAPADTGEYKRSIKFAVAKSGLIAWAYAGRKGEGSKRGYLGHLLEYGTVKTKAYPHFGPALDKVKSGFGKRLERAVGRIRGQL